MIDSPINSEVAAARLKSAVKVTFATTLIVGMLQIVSIVTLARLLLPVDYGYYVSALAISSATVVLFNSVVEGYLVVDREHVLPNDNLTCFMVSLLLALIVFVSCLFVRAVLGWTISPGVLFATLIAQSLGGLTTFRRAMLRRRLEFHRIAIGEMIGIVIGSCVIAITFAARGWGAYALAVGLVGQYILQSIVILGRDIAISSISRPEVINLILRSSWRMGKVSALERVNAQLSSLVLSFTVGPVMLGTFNRAFNIIQLPVQLLTTSITRVLVSTLASVADDRLKLQNVARNLIRTATAIIGPVSLGMAGSSQNLVNVLLGEKWRIASALIPGLALSTLLSVTALLFAVLAESQRRFDDKFRIQTISSLVLVLALLGSAPYGLTAVSYATSISSLVFLVLNVRLSSNILSLPLKAIVSWFSPGIAAGAFCFAAAYAVGRVLILYPSYTGLVAQISACGLVTVAYYSAVHRELIRQFVNLAWHRRGTPAP